MKCQQCGGDFPRKQGRFCGTYQPANKNPPKIIVEIVEKYLKENGFDGLAGDDCGCAIGDLFCCGFCRECKPAYEHQCRPGAEYDLYYCTELKGRHCERDTCEGWMSCVDSNYEDDTKCDGWRVDLEGISDKEFWNQPGMWWHDPAELIKTLEAEHDALKTELSRRRKLEERVGRCCLSYGIASCPHCEGRGDAGGGEESEGKR